MGFNSGLFILSFPEPIFLIFWCEPVSIRLYLTSDLQPRDNTQYICVSVEVTLLSSWVIHLLTVHLGCTCKNWILPLRILAQRSNNSVVSQSTIFPGNFVAWGKRTSAFLCSSTWSAFQQLFLFCPISQLESCLLFKQKKTSGETAKFWKLLCLGGCKIRLLQASLSFLVDYI